MVVSVASATDVGKERETNEDALLVAEDLSLYVVCDGLGGRAGGEVASQLATSTVLRCLRDKFSDLQTTAKSPGGHFACLRILESAVQRSCAAIYERAQEDHTLAGMGTTLTLILLVDNKGLVAHVGDSRLYLLRGEEFHRLTVDHTLSHDLEAAGMTDASQLERTKHVLTRALGHQQSVQVDTLLFDLFVDDICLLCTDGLTHEVDDETIRSCLQEADVRDAVDRLVHLANDAGGRDNISVVALQASPETTDTVRESIVTALSSVRPFSELSFRALSRLSSFVRIVEREPGQTLVEEGTVCPGVFVISSGECVVSSSEDGVIARVGPGELVGAISLLRERRALASLQATASTRCLVVDAASFRRFTLQAPRPANRILKDLLVQIGDELRGEGTATVSSSSRF